MEDERPCPKSRIARYYSRRRFIGGTAAVIGGGALTVLGSRETRAAVSVEDFEVSDAEFEAAEVDPVIDVTIAWEYAVERADEVVIELLIDEDRVADETLRTSQTELANETELAGRVARSDAWSKDDFAVERGENVTREVEIQVRFAVRDGDSVVVEDTATDTAEIVIEHPESGDYAVVGGEGGIRDSGE